eukprot:COSAG05_NODE_3339_length_2141_cov_5.190500_1_plen_70_part_00
MAAAPRDSAGMTPLMLGTLPGDILKVRRLVQMGADVNEVTAAGVSALHIAAVRSAGIWALISAGSEIYF